MLPLTRVADLPSSPAAVQNGARDSRLVTLRQWLALLDVVRLVRKGSEGGLAVVQNSSVLTAVGGLCLSHALPAAFDYTYASNRTVLDLGRASI